MHLPIQLYNYTHSIIPIQLYNYTHSIIPIQLYPFNYTIIPIQLYTFNYTHSIIPIQLYNSIISPCPSAHTSSMTPNWTQYSPLRKMVLLHTCPHTFSPTHQHTQHTT